MLKQMLYKLIEYHPTYPNKTLLFYDDINKLFYSTQLKYDKWNTFVMDIAVRHNPGNERASSNMKWSHRIIYHKIIPVASLSPSLAYKYARKKSKRMR